MAFPESCIIAGKCMVAVLGRERAALKKNLNDMFQKFCIIASLFDTFIIFPELSGSF